MMNYSANDPDDLVRKKIDLDHIESMSKLKLILQKNKKKIIDDIFYKFDFADERRFYE